MTEKINERVRDLDDESETDISWRDLEDLLPPPHPAPPLPEGDGSDSIEQVN